MSRTTPKKSSTRVSLSMDVPDRVTNMGKQVLNKVWDASCPFASLFLWIMIIMSLYYLFIMPDISVKIDQDQVKAEKVTRTLRGWLFLVTLTSGIVGFQIIRQGCDKVGIQWSVLWFLAAWILSWFATRVVLASVERITLAQASDLLKQMN